MAGKKPTKDDRGKRPVICRKKKTKSSCKRKNSSQAVRFVPPSDEEDWEEAFGVEQGNGSATETESEDEDAMAAAIRSSLITGPGSTSRSQEPSPETGGTSDATVTRSYAKPTDDSVHVALNDRPIAIIRGGKLTATDPDSQNKIAGFWITNLRRELKHFWSRWKDIPNDDEGPKDLLWARLKAQLNMSHVDEDEARRCWEKRNHDKYRKFLSKSYGEALKLHNVSRPEQLRGREPLWWVPSEDMWNNMVKHWSSEAFQRKSKLGKKARMSLRGKYGKISKTP